MAICVTSPNGVDLQISTEPLATCTGYVMQSLTDYQSTITLTTLFGSIDSETCLFLFRGGFVTVLFTWIIAKFYAMVFEMFHD